MARDDASLAGIIMDQILAALNSDLSDSEDALPELIARRRARSLVNRVIEYTKAKLDQHSCPGISDICYDLKVNERTLQYSFKTVLELSPNAYLRCLRLNRVRSALMHPTSKAETVTRVAMQWHFLHLGRFSRDYRQVFDELPSVTLRRALGQSLPFRK
jgi:AraC family ethanolamine operon transcriptional activator